MTDRDDFTDELLSAYLDGELSADEQTRAVQLLANSAAHRQLLDELVSLRQDLQFLPRPKVTAGFVNRVVTESLRRAEESGVKIRRKPLRPVPDRARWIAVLASVAAILALAAVPIWRATRPKTPGLIGALPLVFETQADPGESNGTGEPSPTTIAQREMPVPPESGTTDNEPRNVRVASATNQADTDKADISLPQERQKSPSNPAVVMSPGGIPTNTRLVAAFEVVLTSHGAGTQPLDRTLKNAGVRFERDVHLAEEDQQSLLASRFLEGHERAATDAEVAKGQGRIELLYVVATGEQVERIESALHALTEDVRSVRINVATHPEDLINDGTIFKRLKEVVQVASGEPNQGARPLPVGRARRLTWDGVVLGSADIGSTTPRPPHHSELTPGRLGANMEFEVLYIVHYPPQ